MAFNSSGLSEVQKAKKSRLSIGEGESRSRAVRVDGGGVRRACLQVAVPPLIRSMLRVAYLFERFPSFGQTFCYREVAELLGQGAEATIFSIRRPSGEPAQDWNGEVIRRVVYVPGDDELVEEIDRANRGGKLPAKAARSLKEWGRQSDFLRLYQAAFVGMKLEEARINRVHAHFAGMAARTAYWIREFFGIEFSLTVHANDIFAPREFVVHLGKIFEAATVVVTVSDFAVARLRERFPDCATKFHRVYNGVEVETFRPAMFHGSVPLILSIGRLIEKKGFGDLIDACAELKAAGFEFRCEIVGEGPLDEVLAAQIAARGLQREVELLGPLSQFEIKARLQVANVFVLACTRDAEGGMDNLPTVIMEAMASGLPVISTHVGGVPEMVQPGVNGGLVAEQDAIALAEALGRMITDAPRARKFGAESRRLAQEKFSLVENVRSLARLLSVN